MSDPRFYDAASGLLTREAFGFMVDHQLKHAQRVQEFITLVVFLVERRWRELVVERHWHERVAPADDWIVKEMARLIRYAVRSTDLLARTASGAISLLLVGIDGEAARDVIARLNGDLRRYRTSPAQQVKVGVACCPTDAVGGDDLLRVARRRATRGALSARRAGDEALVSGSGRINGVHLDARRAEAHSVPPPNGQPVGGPAFVERRRLLAHRTLREN